VDQHSDRCEQHQHGRDNDTSIGLGYLVPRGARRFFTITSGSTGCGGFLSARRCRSTSTSRREHSANIWTWGLKINILSQRHLGKVK
jgi:hypothetical protein